MEKIEAMDAKTQMLQDKMEKQQTFLQTTSFSSLLHRNISRGVLI